MRSLLATTSIIASLVFGWLTAPRNEFEGLMGVRVMPGDDGGMTIKGFIEGTPAWHLNKQKELMEGDLIVKLVGRDTNSIEELRRVRDTIPFGSEGKLVLRGADQEYYYVWISRQKPIEDAPTKADSDSGNRKEKGKGAGKGNGKGTGGTTGRGKGKGSHGGREAQARADQMRFGGKGRGDDQQDLRAIDGDKPNPKPDQSPSAPNDDAR